MKLRPVFHALAALASVSALAAAEQMLVTVTHDLTIARPSETIVVPWSQVNAALPGALLQRIAVKDATGRVLPYQVTNVAPQAKDPKGVGIAYGELIFQHNFAAGEKSATFTIEKIDTVAPVFPIKTYGRYVPERLDDFAWENDKIGHRTYGPALAAPVVPGVPKEVLVTSGLDVWCKRVNYLIVDRWYNKGHDHYPKDEGEGMDMYQVGPSRGCGGTGVWVGKTLYDAWDAAGTQVSEVKRFTVDAGHNLDQIESTFTVAAGGPKEITVAIGLNKTPADKNQDASVALTSSAATGTLTQWVTQKTNGELGTALIMPTGAFVGFAADALNELILAKATSGQPLRYYAGAGWSKAGEFKSQADWNAYVAACATRVAAPIKITVASQ